MVEFEEHINLVYFIYNKYFRTSELSLKEDLQQEGLIALFKCCKNFDLSKKIKFSTYASKSIYNNMLIFLQKSNKINKNIVLFSQLDVEEIIFDDKAESSENVVDKIRIKEIIRNYFKKIKKRDYQIIIEYYRNKTTMKKLGEKFGVSKNSISKITRKFKKAIKEKL